MSNVLGELFQDIANAIRTKTGSSGTMKPSEFPERILQIITGDGGEGGGDPGGGETVTRGVSQKIAYSSGSFNRLSHINITATGVGSGDITYSYLESSGEGDEVVDGIIRTKKTEHIKILNVGQEEGDEGVDTTGYHMVGHVGDTFIISVHAEPSDITVTVPACCSYTITTDSAYKTINHNLGVTPDIIIVESTMHPGQGYLESAIGFSDAMITKSDGKLSGRAIVSKGGRTNGYHVFGFRAPFTKKTGFEDSLDSSYGHIRSVTDTTFTIGSSSGSNGMLSPYIQLGCYNWYALAVIEEETTDIHENYPVTLDFSSGNQVVDAGEGAVIKSAVIQKPDTLVPGNIARGINIAGIVGTNAGGAGAVLVPDPNYDINVKHSDTFTLTYEGESPTVNCPAILKYKDDGAGTLTFTPNAIGTGVIVLSNGDTIISTHSVKVHLVGMMIKELDIVPEASSWTVTHGMGVIPDYIIAFSNNAPEPGYLDVAFGFSSAMVEACPDLHGYVRGFLQINNQIMAYSSEPEEGFESTTMENENSIGMIRRVTNQTFTFGASEAVDGFNMMVAGLKVDQNAVGYFSRTYSAIAIAGLA